MNNRTIDIEQRTIQGTSNATEADGWETAIRVVQCTNIVLTVICAWLLASSIFWGTKDRRWIRQPSRSGFSSGVVFVTYILTTGMLLATIVLSLAHMNLSIDRLDTRMCNVILESTTVLGYIVTYGTYLFVWIQQRRILLHPCIKDQVSCPIRALNVIFLIACTVTFAVLMIWHFIDPVRLYGKYTCYINTSGSTNFTIGTTTATCLVHLLMLSLSMYPAFQENIQTTPSDVYTDEEQPQDGDIEATTISSADTSCFTTFYKNIKLSRKMMLSSISLTIRRVVYGTTIIFLSKLISGTIIMAIPHDAPSGVAKLPQNIADLVGVFGMLVMLGIFGKVVTFFVPIRSVYIQRVARRTTKRVGRSAKDPHIVT